MIASGLVTLISAQGDIESNWRILFSAGGVTALFGLFLRLAAKDAAEFVQAPKANLLDWIGTLKEHRSAFISIILASGFSYTTYSLAFTLMNGYIPLVTALSKTDVVRVNT